MFVSKRIALGIITGLVALGISAASATSAHAQAAGEAQPNIKARIDAIIRDSAAAEGDCRRAVASRTMRRWEVTSRDEGGTLLFSDSPEYVDRSGILYQDSVEGDARVLYYHLNNTTANKKVAVVLENLGDMPATIRITRGAAAEPSDDYLKVGKATQLAYFGKTLRDGFTLKAGASRVLRADMDSTILDPGELVYGVYDFYASERVRVSVIMYPEAVNPLTYVKRAPILPKDEQRLRGTFPGMNRVFTADRAYDPERDGTVYFPVGDNIHDTYRTGIDATDGSYVENYGNYGILYRFDLPTVGRSHVQYYLSPLGGVYAGAMSVRTAHRTSLLPTPAGRTYFGDATPREEECVQRAREQGLAILTDTTELSDLGTYPGDRQTSFEYSPPGASNLPVNIIMMPANKK